MLGDPFALFLNSLKGKCIVIRVYKEGGNVMARVAIHNPS